MSLDREDHIMLEQGLDAIASAINDLREIVSSRLADVIEKTEEVADGLNDMRYDIVQAIGSIEFIT